MGEPATTATHDLLRAAFAPSVLVSASPACDRLCSETVRAPLAEFLQPHGRFLRQLNLLGPADRSYPCSEFSVRWTSARQLALVGDDPALRSVLASQTPLASTYRPDRGARVDLIAAPGAPRPEANPRTAAAGTPWYASFVRCFLATMPASATLSSMPALPTRPPADSLALPTAVLYALTSQDAAALVREMQEQMRKSLSHDQLPLQSPNLLHCVVVLHEPHTVAAATESKLVSDLRTLYGGLDVAVLHLPPRESRTPVAVAERIVEFLPKFVFDRLVPFIQARASRMHEDLAVHRRGLMNSLSSIGAAFGIRRQARPASVPDVDLSSDAAVLVATRRLGDFCFYLRAYDQAASNYRIVWQDLKATVDSVVGAGARAVQGGGGVPVQALYASLAGAYEAHAYSVFLREGKDVRPALELAYDTYRRADLPVFAARATMLLYETLKVHVDVGAAYDVLVRAALDARDPQIAALFFEQAAQCANTASPRPLLRKFAHCATMAAHRYYRARWMAHAYRCFSAAAAVYVGPADVGGMAPPSAAPTPWPAIGDQLWFPYAQCALALGRWGECLRLIARLPSARTGLALQSSVLREFLHVYRENLNRRAAEPSAAQQVEDSLPVPFVRDTALSLYLPDHFVPVGTDLRAWVPLEADLLSVIDPVVVLTRFLDEPWRPDALPRFRQNLVAVAGERLMLTVTLHNPLILPLQLTRVQLLCEYEAGGHVVHPLGVGGPCHAPHLFRLDAVDVMLEPRGTVHVTLGAVPLVAGVLRLRGVGMFLGGVAWGRHLFPEVVKGFATNVPCFSRAPLAVTVVERRGLLEARLLDPVPTQLFEGETSRNRLRLRNVGSRPLRNVRLQVSLPNAFVVVAGRQPAPRAAAESARGGDDLAATESLGAALWWPHGDLAAVAPGVELTLSNPGLSDDLLDGVELMPDAEVVCDVVMCGVVTAGAARAAARAAHAAQSASVERTFDERVLLLYRYETSGGVDSDDDLLLYRVLRATVSVQVRSALHVRAAVAPSQADASRYNLILEVNNVHKRFNVRLCAVHVLSSCWTTELLGSGTPGAGGDDGEADGWLLLPSQRSVLMAYQLRPAAVESDAAGVQLRFSSCAAAGGGGDGGGARCFCGGSGGASLISLMKERDVRLYAHQEHILLEQRRWLFQRKQLAEDVDMKAMFPSGNTLERVAGSINVMLCWQTSDGVHRSHVRQISVSLQQTPASMAAAALHVGQMVDQTVLRVRATARPLSASTAAAITMATPRTCEVAVDVVNMRGAGALSVVVEAQPPAPVSETGWAPFLWAGRTRQVLHALPAGESARLYFRAVFVASGSYNVHRFRVVALAAGADGRDLEVATAQQELVDVY